MHTRRYLSTWALALLCAPFLAAVDACDVDVHLGQVDAGDGDGDDAAQPDPEDAGEPPDADAADGAEPADAGAPDAGDAGSKGCEACGAAQYCERSSCNASEGSCVDRPEACDDVYQPVCGCDGNTYGNDCEAAAARVNVARQGACEDSCEGGCDAGQYCQRSACDASDGSCIERPDACDLVYQPICGCDGNTYGNECEAAAAGVNVARQGACEDPCQGSCGADEYCQTQGCDADTGTCVPRGPGVCTREYAPVCGCDGATYGNDCEAEAAGVNIDHEGECGGGGEACDILECPGQPGALVPDFCSDGSQASLDCKRDAAGDCTWQLSCELAAFCGGIAGVQCEDPNQFCDLEAGTGCAMISDASGYCRPIPEGCTTEFDPVCGCDGQTYGNRCEAHANGVSVAASGGC